MVPIRISETVGRRYSRILPRPRRSKACRDARAVLQGEDDAIAIQATLACLLREAMPHTTSMMPRMTHRACFRTACRAFDARFSCFLAILRPCSATGLLEGARFIAQGLPDFELCFQFNTQPLGDAAANLVDELQDGAALGFFVHDDEI